MYADVMALCTKCPECAVVTGAGPQHKPLLKPIPVRRPCQTIGLDIMGLSCTKRGN